MLLESRVADRCFAVKDSSTPECGRSCAYGGDELSFGVVLLDEFLKSVMILNLKRSARKNYHVEIMSLHAVEHFVSPDGNLVLACYFLSGHE